MIENRMVMIKLGTYHFQPVYEIGIAYNGARQSLVLRGNFHMMTTALHGWHEVDIFTHVYWLFETANRRPITDILILRGFAKLDLPGLDDLTNS